jgi:hypothetical protein
MTEDPNAPDVIYLGTGETVRGVGIIRSTDFGQTWTQLPATADWWSTWRIAVTPGTSTHILAAIMDEHLNDGATGLRLSTDAGSTWTPVGPAYSMAWTVLLRPGRPTEAVAAIGGYVPDLSGPWRARVARSTDGGATWTESTGFDPAGGRIELAYAPKRPDILYGHQNGRVWRSADGGTTFVQVGTLPASYQYDYNNALWVSPTNSSILVVGVDKLLRSLDGGRTFAQIASGFVLTQDPHPDVHVLVAAPGFDGSKIKRLFVGTDGGLFVTDDILNAGMGKGWRSLNSGMVSTQFYHASGDASSKILAGGTQDNASLQVTASGTGAYWADGDGGWSSVDPTDGVMFYASGQYLSGLVRSPHADADWYDIGQTLPELGSAYANFIAPVLIDPNSRDRMFVGGLALWRSDNVRLGTPPTWTSIKPPLGGPTATYPPISTIGLSKGHPGTVWVAYNDGQVYRTENGLDAQPTWITVDNNADLDPLPNGLFSSQIMIDARDTRRAFICMGGYGIGLWRTDDAGRTWRSGAGQGALSLPQVPMTAIVQHPLHPDWLYVGTFTGLYASQDFGETWTATNQGPANVWVSHLDFLRGSRRTLLAATYGRGLWTINIP